VGGGQRDAGYPRRLRSDDRRGLALRAELWQLAAPADAGSAGVSDVLGDVPTGAPRAHVLLAFVRAHCGARRSVLEYEKVTYDEFVASKLGRVTATGITKHGKLHSGLFPHQRDVTSWALQRGRAAAFLSVGLGKSRIQVEWAKHVAKHTGKRVLILAPLSVGAQTAREGAAIDVAVKQARRIEDVEDTDNIVITNYERMHRFVDLVPGLGGIVCDESSILKHESSKTFSLLTDLFRATPFKLCATATPSPNDYGELGTHAEFLGICTRSEMLSEFFCHDGGETQVWRLKGHARKAFWKWVASWGAMLRKPSDLGYDDAGYALPPMTPHIHTIHMDQAKVFDTGVLFAESARGLMDRRTARKDSIVGRVEQCAKMVNDSREPWLIWCDLNAESEMLASLIPAGVEIRGSHTPEQKELAAANFLSGEARVLISKPSIFGFGLNFQHCARQAFVGLTDSWEAYHQAVGRSWRFGQNREVEIHIFASDAEGAVVANIKRKQADADRMSEELAKETGEMMAKEIRGFVRETNEYGAKTKMAMPAWLKDGAR
jgi:hypothetical protein